jgi:hypothetical protein
MSAAILNDRAQANLLASGIDPGDPENDPEIIAACRRAAEDLGFLLDSETHPEWDGTTECDQVEQYTDPRGESVTLWIVDIEGVPTAYAVRMAGAPKSTAQ